MQAALSEGVEPAEKQQEYKARMLELYLKLGMASQAVPLLEQQLHDAQEGAARLDVLCQLVSLQVSTAGCMLCSRAQPFEGALPRHDVGFLNVTQQLLAAQQEPASWRCPTGLLAIRCMPQTRLF